MRFAMLIAAVGTAALSAMAASAATIVQGDSEGRGRGFEGFDTSLGRLDAVTLDINLLKYRYWRVDAAPGTPRPNLDWHVAAQWRLNHPSLAGGQLFVPISGSGNVTVQWQGSLQNGNSYGYFAVSAVGGLTNINLDPTFFQNPVIRYYFDGVDVGRFDPTGADTSFVDAADINYMHVVNSCQGGGLTDDNCGYATYRLTYYYTPQAAITGVPEPLTWAMITVGFGFVGGALRRRKAPALA